MVAPAFLAGFYGSELANGLTVGAIRLLANGVSETLPYPAAGAFVLSDHYFMGGDGAADDLLDILADACLAHSQVGACAITQDGDGTITVNMDVNFSFLQTHVANTADLTIFGLHDSVFGAIDLPIVANDPYTFPSRHDGAWFPREEPSEDSFDEKPLIASEALPVDGVPFIVEAATESRERRLGWDLVEGQRVREELAAYAVEPNCFEAAWTEYFRSGRHVRYYPDTTARTVFKTYVFRPVSGEYPWKSADGTNTWWNVGPFDLRRIG